MNTTLTAAILALGANPNAGEQLIVQQIIEREPLGVHAHGPIKVARYTTFAELGRIAAPAIEIHDR